MNNILTQNIIDTMKNINQTTKQKEDKVNFLNYLEKNGVDTKEMKFKETEEDYFNFKEAINLAFHDILEENSLLYDEVLNIADIDFKKAITIRDSEKEMELKKLIESYKKDVQI